METKVIIEHRVLHRLNNAADLQLVATVYIETAEYRIYAPAKATGAALDWLAHVNVHEVVGDGENDVQEPLRSSLIRTTRQALEANNQPTEIVRTMIKSTSTNPRKVFVVYGRNNEARKALFTFLQAIDLEPIEWGQAVDLTGQGAPTIGKILDDAFTSAQAAIILLTGDDIARLGTSFLTPHDPPQERDLTPQARQNVVFEAGMAFGRYPERTILVKLGYLRLFSDIDGRNFIRISDSVSARQALADRLATAGCAVNIKGKDLWHTAGNFDAAIHDADLHDRPTHIQLKAIKREAQFDQAAMYKRKVWIQFINQSDKCIELREPRWKNTPLGMRGRMLTGTMQMKIGTHWCPEKLGVDRLQLPPGELCKLWIEPADDYQIEDIERLCQSDAQIGILVLMANGVDVALDI